MACVTLFCAAEDKPAQPDKAADKPGEWLHLPSDGTPWKHPGTDLRFPQHLGKYTLRIGFQDKQAAAGVALSYVHDEQNMKGDIVLFPCGKDLTKINDILAFVHGEHDKLVNEIQVASRSQGYVAGKQGEVEEKTVHTWQGDLPMTVQTLELGPAPPLSEADHPRISQWLGLLIYQDHFMEISIVRPAATGAEGEKQRNDLVAQLLQCVREPSVVPEMLKLCRTYVDKPLTKEGREAADSLLSFSRASAVFRVIFPGEVLTPALDQISAVSKDTGYDLLRSFIVGSAVVALQNGTADQSLEEGGRLMAQMYNLAKKDDAKISSTLLDELSQAADKQQGAQYLRKKMQKASGGH